ncbi:hypothetical protein A3I18_01100 [Candidatus Campbellbacteria bacterium RIFCSPLOWO2_02_FULL_35_11]|uniref:Uncharacterized protein n=2 Tax=Candidatus Campbelliibacteriota TaxID=1752727 RepID=A0A1F5EP08_9BACT|nr:MAG: hypothetical protein A3E89_00900 [Candidatus Campbellbacteria bacterium RIFCSPHIGHO2_12_FULL_35_10]OGD70360.1 MAG: hypothetical protein A3I18_01100 [Candidatus Campbellbacteria bacterium RIFCSPLOWO2_02_FULL_35_11]
MNTGVVGVSEKAKKISSFVEDSFWDSISIEEALLLNRINKVFLCIQEKGSIVRPACGQQGFHFCGKEEKSDFILKFHKGLGSHKTMSVSVCEQKSELVREKITRAIGRAPSITCPSKDRMVFWWTNISGLIN